MGKVYSNLATKAKYVFATVAVHCGGAGKLVEGGMLVRGWHIRAGGVYLPPWTAWLLVHMWQPKFLSSLKPLEREREGGRKINTVTSTRSGGGLSLRLE